MKIATRIIAGFSILIALLAGLVAYQVVAIHRMQSIARGIAQGNFEAALAAVQLMRDRDLVEEYAKKALIVPDPAYTAQLKSFSENFSNGLEEIRAKARLPREREEIQRLSDFWNAFSADLDQWRSPPAPNAAEFPAALQDHLDALRSQVYTVYQSIVQSIAFQAEQARLTGERAELVSWFAALAAVVFSALVSFFIVRSISIPLGQLTEGTRALAAGKFYFRLDTSGRDEFAQLARDFNTMTLRLGELDVLKKAFVSHVSHELKAPLASIRETTQLILEEIPGPLTAKQRRLLDLNLQSSRRLNSIIGNLLDLSKMEAGIMEYDLKKQILEPLLRSAMAEYEAQAKEKGVALAAEVPEEPVVVECDADRIVQVVGNVLSNAIKFSPKGGGVGVTLQQVTAVPSGIPVRWRASVADQPTAEGFAQIAVRDAGPGVPDRHKEMIFERFHQATPGKKLAGQGVGLGLAISQTIVEAHRGAIWVEDNPQGGSIFYVLLRIAAAAEQSLAASREAMHREEVPAR